MWFQEGLAQAFAGADTRSDAWRLMVRNRTWIPFTSLDGTFADFEGRADVNVAYAQAHAMVELMRDCGGDDAIRDARKAFQAGADTRTVMAGACKREEVTGEELLAFIEKRLAVP